MSEPPRRPPATFVSYLTMAMELPFVLVGGVVIGGGLGYWLDGRLHTSPWLALVFGALGFLAGIREVLRRLKKSSDGK